MKKIPTGNLTAIDPLHWAKRLKSPHALRALLEGANDEPKLAAVLDSHIEVGNVIDVEGYWALNPNAERDTFGGLVRFD